MQPSQTKQRHLKPNLAAPSRAKPIHAKPNHTNPNQVKPHRIKQRQTNPSHNKPNQSKPLHTKPIHPKPRQAIRRNTSKQLIGVKHVSPAASMSHFFVASHNADAFLYCTPLNSFTMSAAAFTTTASFLPAAYA